MSSERFTEHVVAKGHDTIDHIFESRDNKQSYCTPLTLCIPVQEHCTYQSFTTVLLTNFAEVLPNSHNRHGKTSVSMGWT